MSAALPEASAVVQRQLEAYNPQDAKESHSAFQRHCAHRRIDSFKAFSTSALRSCSQNISPP